MSFSAADLAAWAVQLEERGERFYTLAAESTPDPSVREVFRRLAEDEKEHAAAYRHLFGDVAHAREVDKEVQDYVRAVLGTDPFAPDPQQADLQDPRAALARGIQAEKDSILLYQQLYDLAVTDEERGVLARLLRNEKFHLLELNDTLNNVG